MTDKPEFTPVMKVKGAILALKTARDLLVEADAPKAADKVRRALKSAGGALRNAESKPYREASRLEAEAKARKNTQATTGRSLVVVKNAIVEREFKKLGIKLHSSSRSEASPSSGGYHAGRAAGDRATFGRPINGGAGVKQIGGR